MPPSNPSSSNLLFFSSLVRPNPPQDVKLVGASATSIDLSYKIDNDLHYFPPGLEQDVEYRSQYDPQDQWTRKVVPFVNTTAVEHDVPLDANTTFTQLLPYTKYFVKIRMLSRAANASDPKMWSSYVEVNATTKAEIPSDPPQTTLGSFEVVSHELQRRSIYVYWKNLPTKHHNGPHFGYEVTEVLEANKKR